MRDERRLTPAEFELIEILWEAGKPLSVAGVRAAIRRQNVPAYTTVMTVLDKMARKGSLRRVKAGKAYFYRAGVERAQVLSCLIGEFADQYFNGSLDRMGEFLKQKPSLSTEALRTAPSARRTAPVRPQEQIRDHSDELDVSLL